TTDEAAEGFEPGSHATTFGGGALTSAVAAKTVEIMLRDRMADRAAALGERVKKQLESLRRNMPDKIRDVRCLGLMIGIELVENGQKVWEALLRRGYICNLSHGNILRLLPPLVIEETDLDGFVSTLGQTLHM
ncbi:MAG: aminotransferase class III-fold pyridoxal phosphate-dependent enzyme, partial [Desulfovibrio sp.]|nr:aminotransferase class III-fold pyridoxal phosphate-dependent enzyme [Desulfovibrio sp.]